MVWSSGETFGAIKEVFSDEGFLVITFENKRSALISGITLSVDFFDETKEKLGTQPLSCLKSETHNNESIFILPSNISSVKRIRMFYVKNNQTYQHFFPVKK